MNTFKLKSIILFFAALVFNVGVASADSGLVTNYISFIPSALPAVCNLGDLRFDTSTTTLQFCNGSNTWTSPSLVNPMTTLGDFISGGASGVPTRFAGNTTSTKEFLTSTGTGSAAQAPAYATIVGSDLPNPSAITLGGVESLAAITHNFLTSISTSGVPAQARPACADLSNSVASCSTDTTNASNILTGTLGAARLPLPAVAALGGVFSKASVSHNFLTSISSVDGSIGQAQPACADLSNAAASCSTDTTNAANLSSGTILAARMPAFTGDTTTSSGAVATTLATVNSNVGAFTNANITVNAKGLVTAAANGTSSGFTQNGLYSGTFTGANGSNYWSTSSSSQADFTLNGSAPTLTQRYNYNMGTVTIATGNRPGITFTAPATGTVRVDVSFWPPSITNDCQIYLTDGSGTILNKASFHENAPNAPASGTISIFYDVTASTAYTFKLQGSSTGTVDIGGAADLTDLLGYTVQYVK